MFWAIKVFAYHTSQATSRTLSHSPCRARFWPTFSDDISYQIKEWGFIINYSLFHNRFNQVYRDYIEHMLQFPTNNDIE